MKANIILVGLLWVVLSTLTASCGGGGGDPAAPNEPLVDVGGIKVMFSITGAELSTSKEIAYEGSPDSLMIRPYAIAISTDPTCASGFVNIIDETNDTSDCSVGADTSRFTTTSSSIELGENDEIPVGAYQCIKMVYCDTLIFTASTTNCNGTFYHDTYNDWSPGGTAEPQVHTVYFGTNGDESNFGDTSYGNDPAMPIAMQREISVASEDIAILTFVFDFTNRVYFNEGDSRECGLDTPAVSAVAE